MTPSLSKRYAFLVFSIVILTALILLSFGRVPFYENGPVALWSSDVNSDQNSQQLADIYTFTHLIHGLAFYFLLWAVFREKLSIGARLALAMGLECNWEIIENTDFVIQRYREATISLDYYGDSVLNSLGDILACFIGFIAARRFPIWVSVSFVILSELALLFFIKDNLTLNIIMLLYPIEAIKMWQAG